MQYAVVGRGLLVDDRLLEDADDLERPRDVEVAGERLVLVAPGDRKRVGPRAEQDRFDDVFRLVGLDDRFAE